LEGSLLQWWGTCHSCTIKGCRGRLRVGQGPRTGTFWDKGPAPGEGPAWGGSQAQDLNSYNCPVQGPYPEQGSGRILTTAILLVLPTKARILCSDSW
jgi:hypothetical protein